MYSGIEDIRQPRPQMRVAEWKRVLEDLHADWPCSVEEFVITIQGSEIPKLYGRS